MSAGPFGISTETVAMTRDADALPTEITCDLGALLGYVGRCSVVQP